MPFWILCRVEPVPKDTKQKAAPPVEKKPAPKPARKSRGTPPEFILKPRSRSVFEGSTVRFTCTSNGDPEPTIEWFFNGDAFVPDKRKDLKLRNGISTITINNACADDIGDYKVVATNESGVLEHIATLSIEGLTRPEPKPKKEETEKR